MARRIIIEAVACVTKYFVAASVDRGFFLLISMGGGRRGLGRASEGVTGESEEGKYLYDSRARS